MEVLNTNDTEQVSGGVPLFIAFALYGELGCFSAIFAGMATYKTLRG